MTSDNILRIPGTYRLRYMDEPQKLVQDIFHPHDMTLTPLEGTEVNIHLLEMMYEGLDLRSTHAPS